MNLRGRPTTREFGHPISDSLLVFSKESAVGVAA
jgi:hypothetical protein